MMIIYIPGEGANNPLGLYKSTDLYHFGNNFKLFPYKLLSNSFLHINK